MAPQKPAANAFEIDRLATQLAKDPQSKAFLPLAEEYCKVGMWEEAVSVLEDGLRYYPGFITAMVVLGRAYDQLNQPTKARAVLEGAIKLSPENLRAHRTLIKIYAAQGLKEEALTSCRVILGMNPKDEEALSVQASLGVEVPRDAKATKPPRKPSKPKASPPASVPTDRPDPAPTPTAPSSIPHAQRMASTLDLRKENPISTVGTDAQPDAGAGTDGPLRHAETIAKLESWLRTLQQQRRDSPTSKTSDSDP
jgi:tetratricopeptide (TPR) repeat protein